MSNVLFANLAGATLAGSISNSTTTITLTSGQGARFPAPGTSQFFPLTLQNATNSAIYEIVYVTARSGDVLTVVRAREGTTGLAFNAGDLAQNRPTAYTLELLGMTFSIDTGSANALAVAFAPVPANLTALTGVPILIQKSASANTAGITINPNGLGAVSATYPDGSALPAGAWPASANAIAVYNGTSFQVLTAPIPTQSPSSLGSHGWKKYPDPNSPTGYVIEQWGTDTFNGSAIHLPIPFPNAWLSFSLAVLGFAGYNGDTSQIDGFSSLSSFVGYGGHPVSGAGTVATSWIAKGY